MNPARSQVEALISALAPACGVPAELAIRQCEAESSFDQRARSSCGAVGLFQLTPIAIAELKRRTGKRLDPAVWTQNVQAGMLLMGLLLRDYHGDEAKALAAYNWGPAALHAAIEANGDNWRMSAPEETRNYLKRILA